MPHRPPPADPAPAERPTLGMARRKRIALIAHDHCKDDLLDWARYNVGTLSRHELSATGTTGALLSRELGLDVACYRSGPLGGDQQIGAAIVDGHVDFVIFFWDPLRPQPHDVDVKALLRIAVVYNIPIACNRATADFVLSSPLLSEPYDRLVSAVVTTPAAARPLAGGREGGVASARRHGSYGSGAPPADPAD